MKPFLGLALLHSSILLLASSLGTSVDSTIEGHKSWIRREHADEDVGEKASRFADEEDPPLRPGKRKMHKLGSGSHHHRRSHHEHESSSSDAALIDDSSSGHARTNHEDLNAGLESLRKMSSEALSKKEAEQQWKRSKTGISHGLDERAAAEQALKASSSSVPAPEAEKASKEMNSSAEALITVNSTNTSMDPEALVSEGVSSNETTGSNQSNNSRTPGSCPCTANSSTPCGGCNASSASNASRTNSVSSARLPKISKWNRLGYRDMNVNAAALQDADEEVKKTQASQVVKSPPPQIFFKDTPGDATVEVPHPVDDYGRNIHHTHNEEWLAMTDNFNGKIKQLESEMESLQKKTESSIQEIIGRLEKAKSNDDELAQNDEHLAHNDKLLAGKVQGAFEDSKYNEEDVKAIARDVAMEAAHEESKHQLATDKERLHQVSQEMQQIEQEVLNTPPPTHPCGYDSHGVSCGGKGRGCYSLHQDSQRRGQPCSRNGDNTRKDDQPDENKRKGDQERALRAHQRDTTVPESLSEEKEEDGDEEGDLLAKTAAALDPFGSN